MALERLQTSIPLGLHDRFQHNPIWLFFVKERSYNTAGGTKYKSRYIDLQRSNLYGRLVRKNKAVRVSKKLQQLLRISSALKAF